MLRASRARARHRSGTRSHPPACADFSRVTPECMLPKGGWSCPGILGVTPQLFGPVRAPAAAVLPHLRGCSEGGTGYLGLPPPPACDRQLFSNLTARCHGRLLPCTAWRPWTSMLRNRWGLLAASPSPRQRAHPSPAVPLPAPAPVDRWGAGPSPCISSFKPERGCCPKTLERRAVRQPLERRALRRCSEAEPKRTRGLRRGSDGRPYSIVWPARRTVCRVGCWRIVVLARLAPERGAPVSLPDARDQRESERPELHT